jgi:phytoene dehydrogenase-like protein
MSDLPSIVDVVIVGAGLAGLSAAKDICSTGATALLLESSDAPGGRVRTDLVDGMLLDRGFQLFNPAYPQAPLVFDLDALSLRPFQAGAIIAHGVRRYVLADPRRSPRDVLSGVRMPIGSLREKLAFARWAAETGFLSAARIKHRPDSTALAGLAARGVHGPLIAGVIRPFLAGVLGEEDLSTSMRFAELLVRSFVRGTPSLPAAGMRALPDQLAAALPPGTLRLDTSVTAVRADGVDTTDRSGPAR